MNEAPMKQTVLPMRHCSSQRCSSKKSKPCLPASGWSDKLMRPFHYEH